MTIAGLWLSYTFDLTSGASIILVGGGVFLLVLAVRPLIRSGSGAGRLSGQR
jgi:ABC-type Mn2+/Zn2+ transport system permease subunit